MYTAPSLRRHSGARKGLILMVVLALLTAFAIVGLSFVLYADSEAKAAQIAKEAEQGLVVHPYDLEPKVLLSTFLGQLIHDVPDPIDLNDKTSINSAFRGQSLARSMFGYNDTALTSNVMPFNGVGRLHNTPAWPALFQTTPPTDEFDLPNYKMFPGDGFIRDPERLGLRTGSTKSQWMCGFNAPYTYPDRNNMFLAQIDSFGNVIKPSYFRRELFGALDDSTNANWTSPIGKYKLLRPRPGDNNGFPFPEDGGGDVKNLLGNPGGNDSIWIDGGLPIRVAPNGRRYKALFAPLIVELDNRLNLVAHGNTLGGTDTVTNVSTHISGTGWGPWSVNLGLALKDYSGTAPAANSEWGHLFTGIFSNQTPPAQILSGRYGRDTHPGTNGAAAAGGFPFPVGQAGLYPTLGGKEYSRIAVDEGTIVSGNGATTVRATLANPLNPKVATGYFPTYPAGYQTAASQAQLANHPLAYNLFVPSSSDDDRAFSLNNMEALLRFNDSTSYSLTGDLLTLCPFLFAQQKPRSLVTTRAYDIDVPGMSPALIRQAGTYQLAAGSLRPQTTAVVYPQVNAITTTTPPIPAITNIPNSDFAVGDGRLNYNLATGALISNLSRRLDLNRPLPDYPQPTAGAINTSNAAIMAGFQAAQQARQELAKDIFDRLRFVTGADDPATFLPSTLPAAKDAVRWLAQLSVNIVDFIDKDDIMTPFNWNPSSPSDVVYGTELPRSLINEVLVQYKAGTGMDAGKMLVDVWVELMNPNNADSTDWENGGARMHADPSTEAYRLYICKYGSIGAITDKSNAFGVPDSNPATPSTPPNQVQLDSAGNVCQVQSFSGLPVLMPFNKGAVANQGFAILGSSSPLTTTPPGSQPAGVSPVATGNLSYKVSGTSVQPPTILLQRLACPYLPFNASTNPYISVDLFQDACSDRGTPPSVVSSNNASSGPSKAYGRSSPYVEQLLAHASQSSSSTTSPITTFMLPNSNASGVQNDWLVHLDRYLSSPMELLHVSGFKPVELSQRFGDASTQQMGSFNHRVPWFDDDLAGSTTSSHLLYRFFELVETRSHMAGMEPAIFQTSPANSTVTADATLIPLQSLTTISNNGAVVGINVGDVLTVAGTNSSGIAAFENVRVGGLSSSPLGVQLTMLAGGRTICQTINNATLIHTATGGRVAGKINLNSVFDTEILSALADPTSANTFNQGSIDTAFTKMVAALHPSYTANSGQLSVNWGAYSQDQPFQGSGMALIAPAGSPDLLQLPAGSSGPKRTYFQSTFATISAFTTLFEPFSPAAANSHPYNRFDLINKTFNNITSRSNVFAVWLTVGFFEVDQNDKLMQEIGKDEGKNVRHRMFAIVDRTGLAVPRQIGTVGSIPAAGITTGTQLLVGTPGSLMDVVTATVSNGSVTVNPPLSPGHAPTDPVFIMPGNWGPQPGFDVTQPVNREIVPYYSIIE
jgi:hypothetical protein